MSKLKPFDSMKNTKKEGLRRADALGQLSAAHTKAWDHWVKRRKMSILDIPYYVLYGLMCHLYWNGLSREQIRDLVTVSFNEVAKNTVSLDLLPTEKQWNKYLDAKAKAKAKAKQRTV